MDKTLGRTPHISIWNHTDSSYSKHPKERHGFPFQMLCRLLSDVSLATVACPVRLCCFCLRWIWSWSLPHPIPSPQASALPSGKWRVTLTITGSTSRWSGILWSFAQVFPKAPCPRDWTPDLTATQDTSWGALPIETETVSLDYELKPPRGGPCYHNCSGADLVERQSLLLSLSHCACDLSRSFIHLHSLSTAEKKKEKIPMIAFISSSV